MSEINENHHAFNDLTCRINDIDDPNEVLFELCKTVSSIVDFCCFMKIDRDKARGKIFASKPFAEEFSVTNLNLSFKLVPEAISVIDEREPLKFEDMSRVQGWANMLRARNIQGNYPATVFPLVVGKFVPFLFVVDDEQPLDAIKTGLTSGALLSAGIRLGKIIMDRRAKAAQKMNSNQVMNSENDADSKNDWASLYSGANKKQSSTFHDLEISLPPILDDEIDNDEICLGLDDFLDAPDFDNGKECDLKL